MGKMSELSIVLANLKAERDELDRMIRKLEGPHVAKLPRPRKVVKQPPANPEGER